MGLLGEPQTLSVNDRIQLKKDLDRAEELLLTKAADNHGVPMWRKKLEENVASELELSVDVVWIAVGDLLIDGLFRAYGGAGDGDIISYYGNP